MRRIIYCVISLSLLIRCKSEVNTTVSELVVVEGHTIPPKCLSPLHDYPNPLNITDEERRNFHPVVKFPKILVDEEDGKRRKVDNYRVLDLQTVSATDELASEDERIERRRTKKVRWSHIFQSKTADRLGGYAVGRYDENRVNMYASDMFDDSAHAIDGYAGQRTVHIGIDLDGPLNTKVFSFAKGVVHSAGYNADLGDYGNVIVIEHDLGAVDGKERKIWALYGHLKEGSAKNMPPGKAIKRGQYLGRFGDIHENGGWRIPHVHFALSIEPPETHDMPGVVSLEDRPRALVQYPDPRWVLGELY
jgi:murein DD-endopeptidase MepM/ murein hydrolase activator NlpD